jgi:hypothetical protein
MRSGASTGSSGSYCKLVEATKSRYEVKIDRGDKGAKQLSAEESALPFQGTEGYNKNVAPPSYTEMFRTMFKNRFRLGLY